MRVTCWIKKTFIRVQANAHPHAPGHPPARSHTSTRWFKYDQDKLWLVYTQIVAVIFEPPCVIFLPATMVTWTRLNVTSNLRFVTASCYDSGTTNEPAFLPLKILDLRILKRTNDNYVYPVKSMILNASPASYPEITESSRFQWL